MWPIPAALLLAIGLLRAVGPTVRFASHARGIAPVLDQAAPLARPASPGPTTPVPGPSPTPFPTPSGPQLEPQIHRHASADHPYRSSRGLFQVVPAKSGQVIEKSYLGDNGDGNYLVHEVDLPGSHGVSYYVYWFDVPSFGVGYPQAER